MLSFVVQNFTSTVPTLPRTQKAFNQKLLLELPIVMNFVNFLVALAPKDLAFSPSTRLNALVYTHLFIFWTQIWRLPLRAYVQRMGLYTNNLVKSLSHRGLLSYLYFFSGKPKSPQNPINLESLRALHLYSQSRTLLHFALMKASLRVINFFFLQFILHAYPSAQAGLNAYANYIVVAPWIYFYPAYNTFYLRAYHY